MARYLGNATDAEDMFDKLILFLTEGTTLVSLGQEWTIIEDIPTGGDWGSRHVALTPPVTLDGGTLTVCFSLDLRDPDKLGMHVTTFFSYEIGTIIDEQPEYSVPRFVPLWGRKMPFWLVANDRRVTGVIRVSTSYETFYAGLYLPYAGDALNTFPAFVGGSGSADLSWRNNSEDHRAYFDSRNYQAAVWRAIDTGPPSEKDVNNRVQTTTASVDGFSVVTEWGPPTDGAVVMPYGPYETEAVVPYNRHFFLRKMDTLSTGESVLLPMTIVAVAEGAYGELEGVFAVAGGLLASELIITISSIDYLVFQDTFRTGKYNYAALRLA